MLVDAHHHLWQVGRHGFEWPTPDLTPIYRDFGLDDLRAAAPGLGGTIVVQSQPSDADTAWLIDSLQDEALVLGIVGWTDLAAADAPARVAALARQPKVKGLRPMLQGLPDDDWILRPQVAPGLAAMVTANLTFDALVFTRHLPFIGTLAARYPDLRIVIDHGAKPPVATNRLRPEETLAWFRAIETVAGYPNITCKLSGLRTEMAPGQPIDDLIPYVDHLIEVFGPQRLMFGSDWPVLGLRESWGEWHDWLAHRLNHLTRGDRDDIFGHNAKKIYTTQGCR
ncbi:amidohydrolase family protein [Asticcacaulis sp. BYS171W]|uniref:Amidohydrolase family protein n=1 Tax=Asticcacaulis aquaticus TaxID=2984212 RepID=A0ABT5HYE1_9CAUL|nr:amidohydrolase family protein [Asticcacaulis aquaticus]